MQMRTSAKLNIRDGASWKFQFALKIPLSLVQHDPRRRTRFPMSDLCSL